MCETRAPGEWEATARELHAALRRLYDAHMDERGDPDATAWTATVEAAAVALAKVEGRS